MWGEDLPVQVFALHGLEKGVGMTLVLELANSVAKDN